MIIRNKYKNFKQYRVKKSDRPAVKPEMTPIDWMLEALALLALMILLGFVIYHYPKLPEIIPSHFNKAGMPDEYSSKSSFWFMPGIAIFVYTLMSLVALVPHQFNFPVKITLANALKQYTMALRFIRYLKAVIIWLFFYISFATIRVATSEVSGLGLWFLPVFLGFIFIPLVFYVIKSFKNR